MSDSLWPYGLQPTRLLCLWDFLGNSTGVGCHFLLQGIFLTQRSNLALPHCRQALLPYEPPGKSSLGEGMWIGSMDQEPWKICVFLSGLLLPINCLSAPNLPFFVCSVPTQRSSAPSPASARLTPVSRGCWRAPLCTSSGSAHSASSSQQTPC